MFKEVSRSKINTEEVMMQAKLTDEITVKLPDGFRTRLDRVAASDKRKPGPWARKVLEEAVEDWERTQTGNERLPMARDRQASISLKR